VVKNVFQLHFFLLSYVELLGEVVEVRLHVGHLLLRLEMR